MSHAPREARKKIRKTKPGRPQKSNESPLQTVKKVKYIADDPDCEKMLHLIAKCSNYKIPSKVGQGAGKISPGEQSQIQKINNDLSERIAQIPIFSITPDYIYFINRQDRKFSIEDGVVIDNTEYPQIEQCGFAPNFQELYEKVNLLAKELENDFVENLKQLLKDYLKAQINIFNEEEIAIRNNEFLTPSDKEQQLAKQSKDRQQEIDNILYKIRNQPKEYGLLAEWESLKLMTHDFKLKKVITDLDKRADEERKTPSENIRRRHLEDIQKQREEAQKELDDGPLLFLVDSLFRIFDKIVRVKLKKNEQQY